MLCSLRLCIAIVNNIRFSPCNSCFLQMDHKISPANQNSTVKVVKKTNDIDTRYFTFHYSWVPIAHRTDVVHPYDF